MKKRHEEICRSSFDLWLIGNSLDGATSWEEVKSVDEPPDWFLTIHEKIYAVEATSIVEYLSELGTKVSSVSVSASLNYLVNQVEETAREQGYLNGGYLVELAPIPNFNKHRDWLFNALLDYVKETSDVPEAEEREFGRINNTRISITKFKSEKDYIGEMISFGVKSDFEATQELKDYIFTAIDRKAHLLIDVKEPIILLILDSFGYSHITDWNDAVAQIPVPPCFESIFIVKPQVGAIELYSTPSFLTLISSDGQLDA